MYRMNRELTAGFLTDCRLTGFNWLLLHRSAGNRWLISSRHRTQRLA
jgi:hypothetical protein